MHPPWLTWLFAEFLLHLAIFLMVSYHCLKSRREPTSALLWIFLAWAFPVIGPVCYIAFGVNRAERKGWHKHLADSSLRAARRAREDAALPMAYWQAVHKSLAAEPAEPVTRELNNVANAILTDYPLLGGNAIEPLVDGDQTYPRMRAAIARARHHIHFQTFIIGDDDIGREFLDLLAGRAAAGVAVRVLFDRFGSTHAVMRRLFRHYRRVPNMRIAGWTQVNALKRQFQFNLRNHRKIMVVDGREAFMGGINLHAENITRPGRPPIRDYHFQLAGPIIQELQYSFLRDWYFMTDEDPERLLQQAHFPHLAAAGKSLIRLVSSGPTPDENETIANVFFECLSAARRQLFAVTPYFVPNAAILHAFRSAALRGVDVRLLTPMHNNHFYAGLASKAFYEELLAAGVRIFQRHPPFMHAKALIVDDHAAMVGSANLDVRSLRLNYETNLLVFDPDFVDRLKRVILNDLAAAEEVHLIEWRARPKSQRLLENFCHLLAPIL